MCGQTYAHGLARAEPGSMAWLAQAEVRSREPTGCQRKDILQGPTDLHPGHISGGIDPQVRAGKEALQLPGKILVLHMNSNLHETTGE